MAGYQKGKLPPKLAALNIAFPSLIYVVTRREKDWNNQTTRCRCRCNTLLLL